MIDIIDELPGSIVAIAAKGCVTANDYDNALVPMAEEALESRSTVRLYYELGEEFTGMEPGAVWKLLRVGAAYLRRFDRIAVVTSSIWVLAGLSVVRLLARHKLRLFTMSQTNEARFWITEPEPLQAGAGSP